MKLSFKLKCPREIICKDSNFGNKLNNFVKIKSLLTTSIFAQLHDNHFVEEILAEEFVQHN